ncbi:MAG TPA: FAD-dependent oxidoreductase [Streptosporangiaceae bacterium]|nr:FAD-dependent oxidoreductase [Streptosporangiaceae bacterium]
MTVTPDRTARAARAGQALMSRHAELQEVLDQWAGVLAAAADSGRPVRPARNLLRVFVGGGYAGVEALAELQDMAFDACARYPELRHNEMRWMLVEAADRILPEVGPAMADYTAALLRRRHIEVRLRTRLASAEGGRLAGNIAAVLRGGTPRPYRHASAGSVASLGLYRGVAEVYGLRLRGFPAWMVHRTYHRLKLPTMNRRLRVVSDWTLALLFPREVVSLDVLEHPRQDFQAALRVIATGPSRQTSFPGQEEKEDDHHAYHR